MRIILTEGDKTISRHHFISKTITFTHLDANYDNEKHVYKV